jgi:hypothetical protein
MKSWKTPTPDQVNRAVALLGRTEQLRYFFDRLENPLWLEALAKKGFFEHPPPVVKDEARGTASFPPWPASRYLIRMAKIESAQPAVLKVALAIPETENVRVHEDLADVALELPAPLASQFVPRAVRWIESPYQLLLPEKLGSLVGHLSRGARADDALKLAKAVLAVVPDPRSSRAPQEPSGGLLSLDPCGRFDSWHYKQILEKHLGGLVDAAGEKALWLLCDLLESALHLSTHNERKQDREDYSWIWRSAIEANQSYGDSVKDELVSAVRDAAERLGRRDVALVPSMIAGLESRRWRIFRRIALYLLHLFPDSDAQLVEERLCDPVHLNEFGLHVEHEYSLLAKASFSRLSEKAQNRFLSLIDLGPDLKAFAEGYRTRTEKEPTAEVTERYTKGWQQVRLSAIFDVLPTPWRTRYEALVSELGKADHPESAFQMSDVWYGPTSPKTEEELRAMEVGQLIDFLKTWQPTTEWMAPSREGIGRQLSSLASDSPGKFADNAPAFQELDPVYVRSLLMGLREAASQGQTFRWAPVLDLCLWVLGQPREIPGRQVDPAEEDPDWGWTRKAIANLLFVGLKQKEDGIPHDLREPVWRVLASLMDDPDPTPEHEARYGGTNMDPPTLALNTTRGQALQAVVQYGLWIRRRVKHGPETATRTQRDFDEMPEVRDILTAHLDPVRDPSPAVRSVYGRYFPWLALLDEHWAIEHAPKIFPGQQKQRPLRDAAWNAYVVFCQPFPLVFRLLRAEYERAVGDLDVPIEGWQLADPHERLAEHILTLYWSETLPDLSDDGGLAGRYFAKASDALRGHAIEFVGRSLLHTKGSLEQPILERLQGLWEQRLSATATNPERHRKELAAFGWWFASGKFSGEWAIQQLREVLRRVRKINPDHLALEKLAEFAQRRPLDSIYCLSEIIEGDREGWSIHGWRQHATAILQAGTQSMDSAVRDAAGLVIDRLGARGHLEFRSLLLRSGE